MCWFAKREKGEQRAGRGEEVQEGVCVRPLQTLEASWSFLMFYCETTGSSGGGNDFFSLDLLLLNVKNVFTHENWRRRYAGAGCFSPLVKLVALWVCCVRHIIYILCSDWLSDVTTVPNIVSIYCSTVCLPYAHKCLIINFVFFVFFISRNDEGG